MNIWNLDTDDESKLPPYDKKEVIALCDTYKNVTLGDRYYVCFAHRPDPKEFEYKGKPIKPMTYGKGGWNVEHVKYWADIMDEIEPIKITREILEKNHFDPMDIAWWDDVDEDYNFVGWHFVIKGIQFELDATFEYVHQLRQAIRLSGLNVEVVV